MAGIAVLGLVPTSGAKVSPRYLDGANNSSRLTTSAPNLQSVKISDTSTGLVLYCFDKPVSKATAADFRIYSYDANRYMNAASATTAASDANCAAVTFNTALDIQQGTIGAVLAGAVSDSAGDTNAPSNEALGGSTVTPADGATTGPDLTGASVNVDGKYIEYSFDEGLDPSTTLTDTDFSYYTDNGATVSNGTAARVTGRTNIIRVTFPAADNVKDATRVAVKTGAVTDLPQSAVIAPLTGLATANAADSVVATGGSGDTGKPHLTAQSGGPQQYTLTYSTDVVPGTGAVEAVADDGRVASGTVTNVPGSTTQLRVNFPSGISDDAGSIVRLVDDGGAAKAADSSASPSAPGRVNVNKVNQTPGYTDAPDLVQAGAPSGNQQSFRFDENVKAADSASFFAVSQTGKGTAGSGNAAINGGIVLVNVPSSASAAVGGAVVAGAVDPLGHPSPPSGVGVATQAPPTTTPPGTTPPGTTPPGTIPPTTKPVVKHYSTKASVKRRTKSKYKYAGKITSSGRGCKSGRKVVLRVKGKGTKSYGSTSSRSDGTYTIKRRKRLSGKKVYVAVKERAGKKYPTDFCNAGKSKTIKG